MRYLEKVALLSKLIEELRSNGSWCGETHLQKATFFLQELYGVDLDYTFILYKHGPFSFDLRGDLNELVADGILRYEPQQPPYGPRLNVQNEDSEDRLGRIDEKSKKGIENVAQIFRGKKVVELERLGTGLYIKREYPKLETIDEQIEKMRELKPHISFEDASLALKNLDDIMKK
jgi:uncharacterized protein YwgA